MEKAITKAKEGGYEAPAWALQGWERGGKYQTVCVFLDPVFWQCLGKVMGWNGRYNWMHFAHRFFRHIMTGKSADSFFNELL